MQDDPTSKNTPLSPEEEKAKAAILAECHKLAAARGDLRGGSLRRMR